MVKKQTIWLKLTLLVFLAMAFLVLTAKASLACDQPTNVRLSWDANGNLVVAWDEPPGGAAGYRVTLRKGDKNYTFFNVSGRGVTPGELKAFLGSVCGDYTVSVQAICEPLCNKDYKDSCDTKGACIFGAVRNFSKQGPTGCTYQCSWQCVWGDKSVDCGFNKPVACGGTDKNGVTGPNNKVVSDIPYYNLCTLDGVFNDNCASPKPAAFSAVTKRFEWTCIGNNYTRNSCYACPPVKCGDSNGKSYKQLTEARPLCTNGQETTVLYKVRWLKGPMEGQVIEVMITQLTEMINANKYKEGIDYEVLQWSWKCVSDCISGDRERPNAVDCSAEHIICGNGIKEAGEECDDGNKVDNDQCNNQCKVTYCGDSVIQKPNGKNNQNGGTAFVEECEADTDCRDSADGVKCLGCRCACKSDKDCQALDKTVCEGDNVVFYKGKCEDETQPGVGKCKVVKQSTEDCNALDRTYCRDSYTKTGEDWTCANYAYQETTDIAKASVGCKIKNTTNQDCRDNLYCNGEETCSYNSGTKKASCVAGAKPCAKTKSGCNLDPDKYPYSLDIYQEKCDEESDKCFGYTKSACNKSICNAECVDGEKTVCSYDVLEILADGSLKVKESPTGCYQGGKDCGPYTFRYRDEVPNNNYYVSGCVWNKCAGTAYCGDGIKNGCEECDYNDPQWRSGGCSKDCKLQCGTAHFTKYFTKKQFDSIKNDPNHPDNPKFLCASGIKPDIICTGDNQIIDCASSRVTKWAWKCSSALNCEAYVEGCVYPHNSYQYQSWPNADSFNIFGYVYTDSGLRALDCLDEIGSGYVFNPAPESAANCAKHFCLNGDPHRPDNFLYTEADITYRAYNPAVGGEKAPGWSWNCYGTGNEGRLIEENCKALEMDCGPHTGNSSAIYDINGDRRLSYPNSSSREINIFRSEFDVLKPAVGQPPLNLCINGGEAKLVWANILSRGFNVDGADYQNPYRPDSADPGYYPYYNFSYNQKIDDERDDQGIWAWKCDYRNNKYELPFPTAGYVPYGDAYDWTDIDPPVSSYCGANVLSVCKPLVSNGQPKTTTIDEFNKMLADKKGYNQLCSDGFVFDQLNYDPNKLPFSLYKGFNKGIRCTTFQGTQPAKNGTKLIEPGEKYCFYYCGNTRWFVSNNYILTNDRWGQATGVEQTGSPALMNPDISGLCSTQYRGCNKPPHDMVTGVREFAINKDYEACFGDNDADGQKEFGDVANMAVCSSKLCEQDGQDNQISATNLRLDNELYKWECAGDLCATKESNCLEPPHAYAYSARSFKSEYDPSPPYGQSEKPICKGGVINTPYNWVNDLQGLGNAAWTCGNNRCFTIPPTCGNSIKEADEECDDGLTDSDDSFYTEDYYQDPYDNDGACVVDTLASKRSCLLNVCGDGYVSKETEAEDCDNGKHCANGQDCTLNGNCSDGSTCQTRGNDGCSADCQWEKAKCGADNGQRLHKEPADKCLTGAVFDRNPYLENNKWQWECCYNSGFDLVGEDKITPTCSDCSATQKICGDGIKDKPNAQGVNEQCDEGSNNGKDDYGCDANCQIKCGKADDGKTYYDDDEAGPSDPDNPQASSLGRCFTGYNVKDYILQTDGFNWTWQCCKDEDCNDKCFAIRQFCGDGALQADFEDCDDGNKDDNDGCLNNCKKAVCGDGHVWYKGEGANEQCDDKKVGQADGQDDGCAESCQLACISPPHQKQYPTRTALMDVSPRCLTGAVSNPLPTTERVNQWTWKCEFTFLNDDLTVYSKVYSDQCFADKQPVCGDGFLDKTEQCDDGNKDDDDGCSSDCLIECGKANNNSYYEPTEPDITSGNGEDNVCYAGYSVDPSPLILESGGRFWPWSCCRDDNDTVCNNTCRAYRTFCGDGIYNGTEMCDDGGAGEEIGDDDGCAKNCTLACRKPPHKAYFYNLNALKTELAKTNSCYYNSNNDLDANPEKDDSNDWEWTCKNAYGKSNTCFAFKLACRKPLNGSYYNNFDDLKEKNEIDSCNVINECTKVCNDNAVRRRITEQNGTWSWTCGEDSCQAYELNCSDKFKDTNFVDWNSFTDYLKSLKSDSDYVCNGTGNTRSCKGVCNDPNKTISVTKTANGGWSWTCGIKKCAADQTSCGSATNKGTYNGKKYTAASWDAIKGNNSGYCQVGAKLVETDPSYCSVNDDNSDGKYKGDNCTTNAQEYSKLIQGWEWACEDSNKKTVICGAKRVGCGIADAKNAKANDVGLYYDSLAGGDDKTKEGSYQSAANEGLKNGKSWKACVNSSIINNSITDNGRGKWEWDCGTDDSGDNQTKTEKCSARVNCGMADYANSDRSSNKYETVKFTGNGINQCWTAQDVTIFNNTTDSIHNWKEIMNNIQGCTTNAELALQCSRLNVNTDTSFRGICPDNYYIPKDDSWHTLENLLKLNNTATCSATRWNNDDCNNAGSTEKLRDWITFDAGDNAKGVNNGYAFWTRNGRTTSLCSNSYYRVGPIYYEVRSNSDYVWRMRNSDPDDGDCFSDTGEKPWAESSTTVHYTDFEHYLRCVRLGVGPTTIFNNSGDGG